MIVPDTNLRGSGRPGTSAASHAVRVLGRLLAWAFVLAVAGWFLWVYGQIHYYATHDEARPADAIAVFGAAEYDGRPSPVLRARLDHALALYQRNLAPLIITLGGGDQHDSEGAVGHDYLLAHAVPEPQIIAETRSKNTEQSAQRLATTIARENHLNRIIAVSDGTHLFRIHALASSLGLEVYTSPRPEARPLGLVDQAQRTVA